MLWSFIAVCLSAWLSVDASYRGPTWQRWVFKPLTLLLRLLLAWQAAMFDAISYLVLAGLWQVRAGGSVLGYVCIGLGCGLFGHGTGELVARWSMRNDPALQKEQEILRRDERNVAIADHAKGRAFDLMTFVFGALMVSFALMEVDLAALLLLVFAYLFVEGYAVYCRCKYEKEM